MEFELYDLYENETTVKCPYCSYEVPMLGLLKTLGEGLVASWIAGVFEPCTMNVTNKKARCESCGKKIKISVKARAYIDAGGLHVEIEELAAEKSGWFS